MVNTCSLRGINLNISIRISIKEAFPARICIHQKRILTAHAGRVPRLAAAAAEVVVAVVAVVCADASATTAIQAKKAIFMIEENTVESPRGV